MPATGNVHVDQLLTNLAIAPRTNDVYIADQVFVPMTVTKRSGLIAEIDPTAEALRVTDLRRSDSGDPRLFDFKTDTSKTYYCENFSAAARTSDEERNNADEPISKYIDKGNFVIEKVLFDREIRIKTLIGAAFTTSALTSSPNNKWDDYLAGGSSTSDPWGDINAKIHSVAQASGVRPNRIAMDDITASILLNHPDILDRIKYTGGGVIPKEMYADLIAKIWGLEKACIASSFKNTAAEMATPSFSRIWSDDVLIYRYEPVSIGTRAAGAILNWKGDAGGNMNGIGVRTVRMDRQKCDEVIADLYDDLVALRGSNTEGRPGHLLTNVLSSI